MNKEQLKRLSRMELLVFASEAKASDDIKLFEAITDELKERNEFSIL